MKINLNRRSFLKATAAAPVAAKMAAAQLAAQGVDIGVSPMVAAGMSTLGQASSGQVPFAQTDHEESRIYTILGHLRIFGTPKWKKLEHRNWARQSRMLDPDIACMRSVSLQAKLTMQWNRNEARLAKEMEEGLFHQLERASWFRLNKIGWW